MTERFLLLPPSKPRRSWWKLAPSLVAIDCTGRGQKYGAFDRLRRIKEELGVPVLADIATVEEAVQAAQAGADAVLSTLRGYTPETHHVRSLRAVFYRPTGPSRGRARHRRGAHSDARTGARRPRGRGLCGHRGDGHHAARN